MDDLLADGIADDWQIFDGLQTLTLVHRTTQDIDFNAQKLNTQQTSEEICDGCLVRMLSNRDVGSVRQIFERGKSIDVDSFQVIDTIIEVPIKEGRDIDHLDWLIDSAGKRWDILAIDEASLKTRYRLGCRRI